MPVLAPRGVVQDAKSGEALRLDRARLMLTPNLHRHGRTRAHFGHVSHHEKDVSKPQPAVAQITQHYSHRIDRL